MAELSRQTVRRQIQQLDPYQFEEFVGEIWANQGYTTKIRQGSGDRGIDIEGRKSEPVEHTVVIQAKQFSEDNRIGSQKVRNYATLHQQEPTPDSVVIVTTSGFTAEAEKVAREQNVKLVDFDDLFGLIESNPGVLEDLPSASTPNSSHSTSGEKSSDRSSGVYANYKSRSERKRDLRNGLVRAISQDDGIFGRRGGFHIRWRGADDSLYLLKFRYGRFGGFFSRYFGAKMVFHRHPKDTYNARKGTEMIQDIDGVYKAKSVGNETRCYTKKDDDSDIELEFEIIRNIIQMLGSDLEDISDYRDMNN